MAAQGRDHDGSTVRRGAGGLLGLLVLATAAAEAARPPAAAAPHDRCPAIRSTGQSAGRDPGPRRIPTSTTRSSTWCARSTTGAMGLVINRVTRPRADRQAARGPRPRGRGRRRRRDRRALRRPGAARSRLHPAQPGLQGRGHGGALGPRRADQLARRAERDRRGRRAAARSLFALGYAGWAPDQLESELAAGAWVVVDADEALLFDDADRLQMAARARAPGRRPLRVPLPDPPPQGGREMPAAEPREREDADS